MKKFYLFLIATLLILILACSMLINYIFFIKPEDKSIFKISNGYTITENDGNFSIFDKNKKLISHAFFVEKEQMSEYINVGESCPHEYGEKDGYKTLYYMDKLDTHTENNFIILFDNNTALVLISIQSQDAAEDVVNYLTINIR